MEGNGLRTQELLGWLKLCLLVLGRAALERKKSKQQALFGHEAAATATTHENEQAGGRAHGITGARAHPAITSPSHRTGGVRGGQCSRSEKRDVSRPDGGETVSFLKLMETGEVGKWEGIHSSPLSLLDFSSLEIHRLLFLFFVLPALKREREREFHDTCHRIHAVETGGRKSD